MVGEWVFLVSWGAAIGRAGRSPLNSEVSWRLCSVRVRGVLELGEIESPCGDFGGWFWSWVS